jgi:rhodanese-related sulfurtransferase
MIRLLTRTILIAALLAPTALPAQQGAAGTGAHAPVGKTKVLTRQEFDQTLADNPDVILLDLRRPDEITSIGGFPVYLSIQFTDVNKYWERIPKGAKIITVSNHAARAVRAADLLDEKGVKVLGAIGAQTYEQEGGTIVHIKAPEPKAPGSGAAK